MVRYLLLPLALLGACDDPDAKDDGPITAEPGTGDTGADQDTDTGGEDTGDTDTGTPPVDGDGDGSYSDVDCDDADATVYPGAPEVCDGKDNNCDGRFDIDDDADADGTADCEDFCPVYTSPGASGDGRIGDPMGSLQDAVDLAGSSGCNEVRAYHGTYYENVDWGGWPVNAESVSGPAWTIVDGGGAGSVFTFQTGEGEDARVYGFTVTNGGGGKGGAFRVLYTSPTIEGNWIQDNAVDVTGSDYGTGGGVWVYEGSPTIVDNEFTGNDACHGGPETGCDGGAIAMRGGEAYIAGNVMTENTAGDGGAVWLAYSSAIVVNNWISGNAADDTGDDGLKRGQGGGINVQIGGTDGPYVANNVISDNWASQYGGGLVAYEDHASYGDAEIANNVVAFNEVTESDWGAGICQWSTTTPTIYNNIVYANAGVGVYSATDIDAKFTNNLVYGNEVAYSGMTGDGGGNLTSDPKFTAASDDGDWTNDDFTLRTGSPAIDAGNGNVTDVDGSRSDMGAYGGPEGSGW